MRLGQIGEPHVLFFWQPAALSSEILRILHTASIDHRTAAKKLAPVDCGIPELLDAFEGGHISSG
jgi:hypothetical protein